MKKSKQKRITGLSVLDRQLVLFPRRSIVVALVCLVAVYGVVHAAMQEIQFRHQKQQFAQVEQDMQKTYNQIVTVAGEPYESHVTKSCGYPNMKFAHGKLACSVGYVFSTQSSSVEEENQRALLMYTKLKEVYVHGYVSPPIDALQHNLGYYFMDRQIFSCSFSYENRTSDFFNLAVDNNSILRKRTIAPTASVYELECGANAVKHVYK